MAKTPTDIPPISDKEIQEGLTPTTGAKVLAARTEIAAFLPNPMQRAAKARFWKRMDFADARDVNLPLALKVSGTAQLSRWWQLEGFSEWFANKDEAGERLEYLYMLALDAAENLLLDPDANHNAKVQMIKIIAQLAGKEPDKEQRFADEEIGKMSRTQLEQYIRRTLPKVLGPAKAEGDS